MSEKQEIIYLNKPITSAKNDIIGFETYVNKLDAAINADAHMIGVVAPFGAGKSSVIDLLEEKRGCNNENFLRISLWSNEELVYNTNDFHKKFLYQLASQIDSKLGTYVSRRLSKNFGLLKIHLKNDKLKFVLIFIIFLLALVFGSQGLSVTFPQLEETFNDIKIIATIFSFVLSVLIFTLSDIVFSSNKSEGNRSIEEDEIMDLYRSIILEVPKSRLESDFSSKKNKPKKYIIVVEDLDRSSDMVSVISFLKEVRKYYIFNSKMVNYTNDVKFIICVKPESLLVDDLEKTESLYAKLFDYTITIQPINIDNYDSILQGLLEEYRKQFLSLSLIKNNNDNLMKIPGIQWIIRERKIGVREIKERLNIAITKYETLKKNTNSEEIQFEKCAVAAYLITAFEKDFYKTNDKDFEKMIENYLQGKNYTEQDKQISGVSTEYINTLIELIEAKHIDNTYRTYYYNFPKNGRIYTTEEMAITKALLYKENVKDIDNVVSRVVESKSNIIEECLSKLVDLKLVFPRIVFESETIFEKASELHFKKIIEYLEKLDYSDESISQSIRTIEKFLSFDKERKVLSNSRIHEMCKCWSENLTQNNLLKLRKMLCERYPKEIYNFRILFMNEHSIITEEEIEYLDLKTAINLTNMDSPQFNVDNVKNILNLFENSRPSDIESTNNLKSFLRKCIKVLDNQEMAEYLLMFMTILDEILPEFEQYVVESIKMYVEEDDDE